MNWLKQLTTSQYWLQFAHNVFAHTLFGVCGYPAPDWAVRFHDWTASLAWPDLDLGVGPREEYFDRVPIDDDGNILVDLRD